MRFLSLFSGIEAASAAWHPIGWECVGFSEIEPFPCAVLAHHYPDIPNLGDVTKITEEDIKALGQIDLVVFGSPCQNLSVAGNRKGLAGTQSGLFYESIRVIQYAREYCGARFALWENVLGAFSSSKGADFAAVVGQMAGLTDVATPVNGWGKEGAAIGDNGMLEWSCLDAQWFGLAQRRKRVFAIVDFGDWTNRPPILLERESLRGDVAPSRNAQQDIAIDVAENLRIKGLPKQRLNGREDDYPLGCDNNHENAVANSPIGHAIINNEAIAIQGTVIGRKPENGPQGSGYDNDVCFTLTAVDRHAVAFIQNSMDEPRHIGGNGETNYITGQESVVRLLTPIENERLQGFPDNFTKIPYRNKPAEDCPNGVRYRALGNSMAVNVMAWIGKRIDQAISMEY